MNTTSFANADQAPATPPTPAADFASDLPVPAAAAGGQLVPDTFFRNDEIQGEYTDRDFRYPKFQLVQNVGPLTENFQPGNFVYNKELSLGPGPLEITLTQMKKYYMEDLPYGSEQIPHIVDTVEEIRRAGGFPSWEKREYGEGHKYYKAVLDLRVLIKGEPDNSVFPFDFEGTPYAVALWTLQNYAYSKTGTQFTTATQLGLRQGLTTAFWTVTAKREKVGQNWIQVPIARMGGKNRPEFIDWARSLFGHA